MPVILSTALPVLVSVTTCAVLVVPTTCAANVSEAGLNPANGPRPVPESMALCGLPDALSMIESLAAREPGACGAKVIVAVQVPPAPMDGPQLLVWVKSELLVPVMLMPVMLRDAFPVLTS